MPPTRMPDPTPQKVVHPAIILVAASNTNNSDIKMTIGILMLDMKIIGINKYMKVNEINILLNAGLTYSFKLNGNSIKLQLGGIR